MTSPLLFLDDIGYGEMLVIVVFILVFFGADKLPQLARGLGRGIREFKNASSEIRNEFERASQSPAPNPGQGYLPPPAPFQPDAALPTAYAMSPATDPTTGPTTGPVAPESVLSPPAAPVAYHPDLPPAPAVAEGVAGTQPRRAPTSTDV